MCDSHGIQRMIIPPEAARAVIRQAGQAFLRTCPCRAQEQNCPPDSWEVCLLFEHAAPEDLRQARPVSTGAALAVVQTAAGGRAIYHLFFTPDGRITELCSCCTCCCHPLQRIKHGVHQPLRSEYIALTDPALCAACGLCLESCFFEARKVEAGGLHLEDGRCFGCGRCLSACPAGAIRLERVSGRGLPLDFIQGLGLS
ncbi:MAG TPA: 4Fe-4S binding protein [Anaerolineaceae bacterium]|nr:4Fe-4S binding protein [Anaerolineaceae bacterium]HPN52325.1 4Fe-4S binding protein [Anaerolineaceae bacterium]